MGSIPSITDYGAIAGAPDNTTAIQKAFDSGPEIYIPGGSYNTGPLTAPRTLQKIWGPGTLVGLSPGSSAAFIDVADHGFASPLLMEGFGIALGSAYAWVPTVLFAKTALQARGMSVSGGRFGFWGNGEADLSMVFVAIEDCLISDVAQAAVYLVNANVAWVRRNGITGNSSGQWHTTVVQGGTDVVFRDNSIYGGPSGAFGTYFDSVTRGEIHGHYRATPNEAVVIDSCVDVSVQPGTKLSWLPGESHDFGISVGASQSQMRNCRIAGVDIRGCGKSGIYVGNGSGSGAGVKGFLIEGGSIIDANQLGSGNPTPTFSDGVTIGGDGNENGITGTRIFGLTVANDQFANTQYGVREQQGAGGQKPSTTKVTSLHAVGMVAGSELLIGSGSSSDGEV